MYKVFINNHPLFIAGNELEERFLPEALFVYDDSTGTIDLILHLAHTEKTFFKQLYLIGEDAEKLFRVFRSRCKLIEAAGGRVRNAKGELLMIYRSGKWDLPKGKIEKGESPETAALREVEEECGISGLTITKKLAPTFHTYVHKEKIVLKKTYWYEMSCKDTKKLVPQLEEGITEVKWMSPSEMEMALNNTFLSVVDVVRE